MNKILSIGIIEQLRVLAGGLAQVDGIEFAVKRKRNLLLRSSQQSIEFQKEIEEYTILIRLVKNKRISQVVGNDCSRAGLADLFHKCVEKLRFSPEKKGFNLKPFEYDSKLSIVDLSDPSLALIAEEEKIRRLFKMEEKILDHDKRLSVQNCFYNESIEEVTHWIKGSQTPLTRVFSLMEIGAQVTAKSNEDFTMASATDQQGNYYSLDWKKVADRSARRALARLESQAILPASYNVLFSNRIASRLLCSFFEALKADHVLQDASFLANLLDQKIFSDSFTVIDDPHLKALPGSRFWDDEGVPTQRTVFVDKGRIRGFAHNRKSAESMGVQRTGHARLNFEHGSVRIGAHNLYMEPSHKDQIDMMSLANGGLYLVEPEAPISFSTKSGDFFLKARGYTVQGGLAKKAIHGAIIKGKLTDLFSRTIEVGRNLRWGKHYGAPAFMVESIRVEDGT